MEAFGGGCQHLEGLRPVTGNGARCPVCGSRLDLEGIARWVRDAEKFRDEFHPANESFQEWQQEVYRRRRVLYELKRTPQVAARPEMILILYDIKGDSYDCKIFYKEPRPARSIETVSVSASPDDILDLRMHPDPNVRLAAEKVAEFHDFRLQASRNGKVPAPRRRVFYADEL